MRDDEAGRLRELVHERRGSQERTERSVPSPQSLGERDRVGSNVGIVVRREKLARTEGAHDLVEHEADAVAVAAAANSALGARNMSGAGIFADSTSGGLWRDAGPILA